MKINLTRTDANVAAVNAALADVNGKASAFAITSWAQVMEVAQEAERRLEAAGLPKATRKGAVVAYRPAGPSAKAYKYAARSTRVTITRGSSDWYLTDVQAVSVYPRSVEQTATNISPEQRAIIIDHALEAFRVVAPVAQSEVVA